VSVSRRGFLAAAAGAVLGACAAGRRRTTAARPTSTSAPSANGTSAATATTAATRSAPSVSHAGGPAELIVAGPRTASAVALTFHGSGELRLTDALLAEARRLDVPITVFAVGRWLSENPGVAARLVAAGHEVANHTYTHPALGQVGRATVAQEITGCRDVLVRQLGNNGRWFRPSGIDRATPLMLEEAGAAGYAQVVGFDVDPHDYADPGAAAVAQRVADGIRPGSIVSLHLGHSGTVEAFDRMVTAIRARGLSPVLLGELLGGAGR
jgi:peptidoglycan/xylan/chitin deacetylase (PgdA/CDA1 family)